MGIKEFISGPSTNAKATTKYTQLNVQTSAQGVPIPLVWGKKKIGTNLIWYNDFVATPEKGGKKGGGGGKGGEGKGGGTVYDYSVAVILALCEGPITGIGTVWQDKTLTSTSALGLTLFTGTQAQLPWSYVTTKHPTEARSYAETAYLCNSSYSLGRSPNLPNHQFEVITPLSGTMPGTVDGNLADVINDLLTNVQYAISSPYLTLNSVDLAFFKTYQQAQGLFFSPDITSQEQLSQVMSRWAMVSNTWIFWSGNNLRFVPLGDSAITANGATYTPVTTVRYDLSYEDFRDEGSGFPITVDRLDPADAVNHVRFEVKDRTNNYDTAVAEWKDQALVDQYGLVDSPATQGYEICDINIGQLVAQLIGQRLAYIRNTYKFKIGWEYGSFLEPGDIVTINDAHLGLTKFPVRVRTLDEDKDGWWAVEAEEMPALVGTAASPQPAQATTNSTPNYNVDPGSINPPLIFEPPTSLTLSAAPQVWAVVSGGSNWGGAFAYVSFDNVNFNPIGSVSSPAYQGVLTANLPSHADPDTVDTLAIDTTESALVFPTTATDADADAFRTLSILMPAFTTAVPSSYELIAYGSAVAGVGTYATNLTYLRRGLYGTSPAARSTGDFFGRVDVSNTTPPGNSVLVYDLPPSYVGGAVYFKFVSFNRFGGGEQSLSTATTYSFTPSGRGYGTGTGGKPATPTGLAASPGVQAAGLTWAANAAGDNVEYYAVYRATGLSQVFASASLIATTNGLAWNDIGLAANQGYTYFLVAHNVIGDSAATAGVNVTTATTSNNLYLLQGTLPGTPTASETLFEIPMPIATTFASGLPGSIGGCDIAPTGSVTCQMKKNGTNIGTMNIAASATSATFTFTSSVSFAAGDIFGFYAPSVADATLSDIRFALVGTR